MPDIVAFTDGACSGNPGPGGWGAILRALDGERVVKERELSGGEPATTNNRMELMAAISALEALEHAVHEARQVGDLVAASGHGYALVETRRGDRLDLGGHRSDRP